MRRASFAVLFGGCALVGCNSVLGIEEGNLRNDGGGSASVNEGGGSASDSAIEGGMFRALDCGFVFAAHRTIADLSGETGAGRTYSEQLLAEAVPSAFLVRVVAYHAGATLPFEMFSVDAKDNGTSNKLATEMSTPLDMRRIDPSSVGLLTASTGATGASLNEYVIADADGMMPKLVTGTASDLGMVDQVSGVFLPEPSSDIAFAASVRSSPNQFNLVYGKASIPGQAALSSGQAPVVTNPRAILRVGNAIHVFFGDPGGPAGASQVTIADGMTPTAARSLGPPQFFLLSAGTNALGKVNVAFAEVGMNINLRVGQVEPAQVGSFMATDAPVAYQYGGLADVPYTTRPRWFGDALVAVGPTSATANELSIAWGYASGPIGQVQVQKKLLTAQKNGKVRTAAWAAEQQLGSLGGFIDLFWIETYQDDAGQAYDVLYYDQVRCI